MSSLRNLARAILFALPLLAAADQASAYVSVGPAGSPCMKPTIQAAIDSILEEERHRPIDDVDHYVFVEGNNFYNEKLVIRGDGLPNGARVDIMGGYFADSICDMTPGNGISSIGAGGSAAGNSVIEVIGKSAVYLTNLRLTDARNVVAGGGINFHGNGILDLTDVTIDGNDAEAGGGIATDGSAPGLTLALHHGTTIAGNTANIRGGGIFATGETYLNATENTTVVSHNISNGAGGGIAFVGHGTFDIAGSRIVQNRASEGGGVYIHTDRQTDVYFENGVVVAQNSAHHDGGGVYVENATLYAESTAIPTQIFDNTVIDDGGSGGGIEVHGPAVVNFKGALMGNSAGYGGGIAAHAGDDIEEDAYVSLTAANAQAPVLVMNNSARHAGGGIYMKPNASFSTDGGDFIYASLCAQDFVIDNNSAREGTAIYADVGTGGPLTSAIGSSLALNGGGTIGRFSCPGSVGRCADGVACNEISHNFQLGTSADEGSTILVQTDGVLHASNIKMQGNLGNHVIRALPDSEGADLHTALITDNTMSGELIATSKLDINDATIAHNAIAGPTILRTTRDVNLVNTIFAEDVAQTLASASGRNINIDHVLAHTNDNTLPGTTIRGTPTFVDAARGDYHLASYSLGLDVTDSGDPAVDLDRKQRSVDLAIPNMDGPRDLGAYERQFLCGPDTIFCDPFDR